MTIQLRFKSSDPGFCRDYFTYEYNGRRRLACIQQSGRDRYELLSCTSDGEPEARLKLDLFEIPENYQGKVHHD